MNKVDAWRHVAAMATLDKWLMLTGGSRRTRIKAKAWGLVWHDRYLCDTGRKHTHGG